MNQQPEEPTKLQTIDEFCGNPPGTFQKFVRANPEPRAFVESDSVAPKTRYEPSLEDRATQRVRKWRKRNPDRYRAYQKDYMRKRRKK